MLSLLAKSEHGALYHQTLRVFRGMVVALSAKNILTSYHLKWVQYLYSFKQQVKGDWIKVFARALEIY